MNLYRLSLIVFASLVLNPVQPVTWAHKANDVTLVEMQDDPTHQMVWVSCRIKGSRRRYACVIDSGASTTFISDRVLEAEGPVIWISTANGVIRGNLREVSLIISDGLEVRSKALVSMVPQGIDILIGQDVLRQFRSVNFDYRNRHVEFQR